VDDDGNAKRQIEAYNSGVILRYDEHHSEDEYGGLSQVTFEPGEPECLVLSQSEFEEAWHSAAENRS